MKRKWVGVLAVLAVGVLLWSVRDAVAGGWDEPVYGIKKLTVNEIVLGGTQVTANAGNINGIAAGGTAAAFNGAAITALNGANIASGDIAVARVTNALATGTYNVSAARLVAGTAATAINGAAVTNLTAGNLASGTVPWARLPGLTTNINVLTTDATTNIFVMTNGVIQRIYAY